MNVQVENFKLRNHKKANGIFYTPPQLTSILARWAIRDRWDKVLEPSFGGCSFIDTIKDRFLELDNDKFVNQLAGADTDPTAFGYLKNCLDVSHTPEQFKNADFLSLSHKDFKHKFDVIIGNPPYISHHKMPKGQIQFGQRLLAQNDYKLYKRASLWGYFVLHALSFLERGGRLALVLPSSFLNADYAQEIRGYLETSFERILIVQIGERLFMQEGAKEVAVVVFCEGWNSKNSFPNNISELAYLEKLSELEKYISSWTSYAVKGAKFCERANLALLSNEMRQNYNLIAHHKNSQLFSDFATVLIGMVTGDNKYFILSKTQANSLKLPDSCLQKIIAKFGDFHGMNITEEDYSFAKSHNVKCLLFDTTHANQNVHIENYKSLYPKDKLANNKTFQRRSRWDQPNDNRAPDAFFSYMSQFNPQMRLNETSANCTNTIHRVFFHNGVEKAQQKLIVISLLSSFSQLSAEIESRSYGSGVLKHEPSEIKRLKIFIPQHYKEDQIEAKFYEIDRELRKGNLQLAYDLVDDFIFAELPNRKIILQALQLAINSIRVRRIPDFS